MPAITKVDEVMSKDVFTVDIEDTVNKANDIIKENKVRHVPVLEGKKLVGLITDHSLIEYTLRQIYDFDENIEETGKNRISDFQNIMTTDVHIIYPEDSMQKAVQIMAKKKTDCLPVVDWANNLVGILTIFDVLLFFHKKLIEESK